MDDADVVHPGRDALGAVRNRRRRWFVYGEIPAISGVWANAKTLEACREELESVLEGWLRLSAADHSAIPEIDGNRIEREVA